MIRLATLDDAVAVETLVRDAYTIYIARNGKVPGPMRDDYRALIAARRAHVLEENGEILGVLVLIPEADMMLLDNVAVSPSAQGRGFGKVLMAFAEQQARETGFNAIRLYTQDVMVENIALYTRLGYAETHRGEEIGLTRVYMRKMLTPTASFRDLSEPALAGHDEDPESGQDEHDEIPGSRPPSGVRAPQ